MLKDKNLLLKFVKSEKKSFNRFTEIVAVSSIVLGTVALILSLSILEGFDTKLREFSMKFAAHINVTTVDNSNFDFQNDKIQNLKSILPDSSIIIQGLSSEAVVRANNEIVSISIRGIDKKSFPFISEFVTTKNFLPDSLGDNGVIISKTLAEKLDLKINDNLIAFLPKMNAGNISDFSVHKFKIVAIYHSGMTQYDQSLVFSSYSKVAKISNKAINEANSLQIYLPNPYLAPYYVSKIEDYLNYPFFAFTIFDMNQQIFSWIELQKEPIPIILASISIVASLNIITTLLVLILEKVKSIGILRAIGISRIYLLKLMLIKGFKISLYGSLIGSLLSFSFLLIQDNFKIIKLDGSIYYLDALPVSINFEYFLFVNLFAILLGSIVALLPAYIAVRTEIIKAIKFI